MVVADNTDQGGGYRESTIAVPRLLGRFFTCLSIGVSVVALSPAQEAIRHPLARGVDSLRVSSLSFDRVLNTFTWNGNILFAQQLRGVDVNFRQGLRSRLIRTEQRSLQDEYMDTLEVGTMLGGRWRLRAQQVSSVVSDNRAIDLTKLAQHQAFVGFRLHPSSSFSVGASGGYQFDSQQEERDEGFAYEAELEGRNIQLEDFRALISGRWGEAFLTRRRPGAGHLDVAIQREFGNEARNTISFSYERQRREFYTLADADVQRTFNTKSNIFRRQMESFQVLDSLAYQPSGRLRVALQGGIANRVIDRGLKHKALTSTTGLLLDTRIQELYLFGEFSSFYRLADWIDLDLRLSYREREERHSVKEERGVAQSVFDKQQRSERRLDNIAKRTTVSAGARLQPSERDQLNFAGSASILRYDTPDTLNTDDRDELLVTIGVEGTHRFNEYLMLTLTGDVTLSHLVYLKALQSANNSWNRIIRFSPAVEYAPEPWFRTVNQAEVLANYTVYDFEGEISSARSFSFRQASWIDSTTVQLSELLQFNFVGGVRVYERGILLWKEFKERPQNYFVERSFWPRLSLVAMRSVRMGIGYRLFSQDRYRYQGAERILERRLETAGPTVVLDWEGEHGKRVAVEGWRETQAQDGRVIRTVPNLSLRVSMAL
ncbi:MAG: hypothetical protein FJ217_11310 [Ignavibacteria bacterium]|nr:hypothetical protein [Ignavibacteria bacterium]